MNNDQIEFSYGGYFGGYKTLRYSNGTVSWSISIKPYEEHTKIQGDSPQGNYFCW